MSNLCSRRGHSALPGHNASATHAHEVLPCVGLTFKSVRWTDFPEHIMGSGAADVLLTGLREPSVGNATYSGMIEALPTLGPGSRLLLISVASLAALPYIKHVVGRATPGWHRVLPSIPLLVAYCAAHLAFNCTSDVLEKTVAMFIFGWQASFKVGWASAIITKCRSLEETCRSHVSGFACCFCVQLLAFCMNRGPLVGPWSMAQMAAIMSLPLYAMPSGEQQGHASRTCSAGAVQGRGAGAEGRGCLNCCRHAC